MNMLRYIASLICLLSIVQFTYALEWVNHNTYRIAKIRDVKTKKSASDNANGFKLHQPQDSNVSFSNRLSRRLVARNRNLANGSGVAIGDINGDDLPDIYFCGLQTDNKLYKNNGGFKFDDITLQSGVNCAKQYSTGALIEDVDGDGDNDLLVTGLSKGTRLFLNNGKGTFSEKKDSGLFQKLGATSMSMADLDMDGDLDLYVTNYRTTNYKDRPPGVNVEVSQEGGKINVTPSNRFTYVKSGRSDGVNVVELGEQDIVYENLGSGRFKPISWVNGKFLDANGSPLNKPPLDWGLSVLIRDFNNDNLPDIYVCNDYFYSVDKFWINQGGGVFKLADYRTIRNSSMSSMSVDCADINLDGYDDFFVADMLSVRMDRRHTQRANSLRIDLLLPASNKIYQPEFGRNTLQLNRGDGTYAEVAYYAGLAASEWTWSSRFLDVDLDGYQDLILTTGNEADVLDADMLNIVANSPRTREGHVSSMMKYPKLMTPNLIFQNNKDLTFTDRSNDFGFSQSGISHGMAAGDLDNDGDLDIVINNLNETAFVYENVGANDRVAIRLNGPRNNSRAVGAVVKVSSAGLSQSQTVVSGGRYLSSDQALCVFGVPGKSERVDISVLWPAGKMVELSSIPLNTYVEVDYSDDVSKSSGLIGANQITPIFKEVLPVALMPHKENEYNDFETRPLLAVRRSSLGPGLSAIDLDGDLLDELIMSGSKGHWIQGVSSNDNKTKFNQAFKWGGGKKMIRDTLSVLPFVNSENNVELIGAQTNYEDGLAIGNSLIQYTKDSSRVIQSSVPTGFGPMAMADVDRDGDLDLFVGNCSSYNDNYLNLSSELYLNINGIFKRDAGNSVLNNIGSISGAVFSDIDNDDDPDLLLARQWGSPVILINHNGNFTDRSLKWMMSDYHGMWNGISTGDFNNDGLMDIVITNIGRNCKYNQFIRDEIWMYVADYNRDGFVEGVETVFDLKMKKRVPFRDRDTIAKVMPWVLGMYQSYKAFSMASIDSLLEPLDERPKVLKLNSLDTSVFINNGDSFSKSSLPAECQFTSAFGCSIADFNGDGNEDIYLAQNFFDVEPETSRYDAGLGQLVLGNGEGGFVTMDSKKSGIAVLGQSRGSVASDFNGDGRVDIATTQNNDSVKLYFNQTGRSGIRVILKGDNDNYLCVGTTIMLESNDINGPKREIRIGGGYLSQDSLAQVFATNDQNAKFHVKWHDSESSVYPVPAGAKTIIISQTDGVRIAN